MRFGRTLMPMIVGLTAMFAWACLALSPPRGHDRTCGLREVAGGCLRRHRDCSRPALAGGAGGFRELRVCLGIKVLSRLAVMASVAGSGGAHGAELNPAQRLHSLGQSLWLDSINRVMLRTGTLARYVRDLAVTGLTSNPTILGHAMAAGSDYDRSLARLSGEAVTGAEDLVYALALEDLAEAASLFRPVWNTAGVDGYVSLEVPPDVAYNAAATVALAGRVHEQAASPTCW